MSAIIRFFQWLDIESMVEYSYGYNSELIHKMPQTHFKQVEYKIRIGDTKKPDMI